MRPPGKFGPWRKTGIYNCTGRRTVPLDQVIPLWNEGLNAGQIAARIGPIKGVMLQAPTILKAIMKARARGAEIPLRRTLPVEFVDHGISEARQRSLGL